MFHIGFIIVDKSSTSSTKVDPIIEYKGSDINLTFFRGDSDGKNIPNSFVLKDFRIQAVGFGDAVLANFRKNEDGYFEENISFNVNMSDKYRVYKVDDDTAVDIDLESNGSIVDLKSTTFKDYNFTGNSQIEIAGLEFYFKRAKTTDKKKGVPTSYLEINSIDINASTKSKISGENSAKVKDGNSIRFVYGFIPRSTISTSSKKIDFNTSVNIYVSDKNSSSDFVQNHFVRKYSYHEKYTVGQNRGLKFQDFGKVDFNITTTSILSKDDKAKDINVTGMVFKDGFLQFKVENKLNKSRRVYIHIDIGPSLYDDKFIEGLNYSYKNGSSCADHLCIEYNYRHIKKLKSSDGEKPLKIGKTNSKFKGAGLDINYTNNRPSDGGWIQFFDK